MQQDSRKSRPVQAARKHLAPRTGFSNTMIVLLLYSFVMFSEIALSCHQPVFSYFPHNMYERKTGRVIFISFFCSGPVYSADL